MHTLVHESLAILADNIGLTECHDEMSELPRVSRNTPYEAAQQNDRARARPKTFYLIRAHPFRYLSAHVLLEQVRSPMGDFLQDRHR